MLDNKSRVDNEVAAIALMQDALSTFPTRIVPDVYAWNTAALGDGWIVQEHKHGEQIGSTFAELPTERKGFVLNQIAQVFQLLQSYHPRGLSYGGLKFGKDGKVCSGALSIWGGGPFTDYADMYDYLFRTQIERSKSTSLVDGWRDSDLAGRLHEFEASGGLAKLLRSLPAAPPTLVHGDLGQSVFIKPTPGTDSGCRVGEHPFRP